MNSTQNRIPATITYHPLTNDMPHLGLDEFFDPPLTLEEYGYTYGPMQEEFYSSPYASFLRPQHDGAEIFPWNMNNTMELISRWYGRDVQLTNAEQREWLDHVCSGVCDCNYFFVLLEDFHPGMYDGDFV